MRKDKKISKKCILVDTPILYGISRSENGLTYYSLYNIRLSQKTKMSYFNTGNGCMGGYTCHPMNSFLFPPEMALFDPNKNCEGHANFREDPIEVRKEIFGK